MTKSQNTRRARYTRRRGSMIVLAIGVLAVLAIVALSYTAAVRVERTGVQAYTARIDTSRQVDAVVGEIQAVLTADLFGGKLVDSNTPRLLNPTAALNAQTFVWPRMFEDGEYFDMPGVDNPRPNFLPFTFNEEPLGAVPSPGSVLVLEAAPGGGSRYEPALSQDDPWLSSTEPVNGAGLVNQPWDTWPIITNLRSTYRWGSIEPGSTDPTDYAWIRGDGKFVDLAQFFLSEEADRVDRGDPDADLTAFEDPRPVGSNPENGPALGVNQSVFEMQMSMLREYYEGDNPDLDDPLPLEVSDERFWADTDGDLRPDARWQILDSMGDLQGLKWIVATRIIDNSSMVNVNTALDFGQIDPSVVAPNDPYEAVAAGRSPADVDLLRFLRSAGFEADLVTPAAESWGDLVGDPDNWDMPEDGPALSSLQYGGATGLYDTIFQKQHVEAQLRLHDAINTYNFDGDMNLLDYDPYITAPVERPLFRAERDRLFAESSSSAGLGAAFGTTYGIENEIDLRAFWGVNREDTLSELEQRLDAGYLPRQREPGDFPAEYDETTGAQLVQGPLRSADRQRHSRGLVNTGRVENEYELRPTFEEIRDDLRRHITTVSGQSYLSPVPVINDAIETVGSPPQDRLVYSDRAVNLKVAFSDFPAIESPVAVESATPEAVSRAFEAFTWALAPLATEIPVAAGLSPLDVGGNAAAASFHYGGGLSTDNPAFSIANSGGTPVGASYALLRAASLAVNLADAIDRSSLQLSSTDPTRDGPTIARLYPQALTRDSLTGLAPQTLTAFEAGGMPVLTTRFSHGDIPTISLPQQYVGQSSGGVTLVGLDRQPFLREVACFAAYRDNLLEDASVAPVPVNFDDMIDPNDPDEQIGSVIAFELGNPWPEAIDVRDYVLRLAVDDGSSTNSITVTLANVGNTVISPGAYSIFYVYSGSVGGPGAADWPAVLGQWQGEVTARAAGVTSLVGIDAGGGGVAFENAPGGSVMFQTWGVNARPVALVFYDSVDDTDDPWVLVDRMSPPAGANAFPEILSATETISSFIGSDGTGRAAVSSSFTRRIRPPTIGTGAPTDVRIGGFPAYIIERPEEGNNVSPAGSGIVRTYWAVGTGVQGGPVDVVNIADPSNNLGPGPIAGGDVAKGHLPGMPSIQLFAPNRALETVGDLAMLSAFTHMFVHSADDAPIPGWLPVDAARFPPTTTGVSENGRWVTIGEQLGGNMHFTYDAQPVNIVDVATFSASNANPYLGVLDPTRFTLAALGGDLSPVGGLPDSMSVPLAVRVFDCFEAVGSPRRGATLAQGRINVNTSPLRTLRMIPFMTPEQTIQSPETPPIFDGSMEGLFDAMGGATGYEAFLTSDTDRAGLIAWYRDATAQSPFDRASMTLIGGVRSVGFAGAPVGGLVASGELSILSEWSTTPGPNIAPTPIDPTIPAGVAMHFGELGQQIDPALNIRRNTGVAEPPLIASAGTGPVPPHVVVGAGRVDGVLDRYPNAIMPVDALISANLDPIDDAEERTAVYRAMSNIVSTRSDVYTAWFVIRGYDPDRISSIAVPNSDPDDEELNALMNQLKPTHESRWLAVFDRSNVRLPTDRPKILLLTKLPTR